MKESNENNHNSFAEPILCVLLVYFLAVPMHIVQRNVDVEIAKTSDTQGYQLIERTDAIWDYLDLGQLQHDMHNVIPADFDEDDVIENRILKPMADWASNRIDMLCAMLYVILLRIVSLLHQIAFAAPALAICLACGWLSRQANRWVFAYTSPYLMHARARLLSYTALIIPCMIFWPWVLHPLALAFVTIVAVLLSGLTLASVQKQI